MNIITIDVAKEHLRVFNCEEEVTIDIYLGAAEFSASMFMNRDIFYNAAALATAKDAAPAGLTSATAAYDAAILATALIDNKKQKKLMKDVADAEFLQEQMAYVRAVRGIVINKRITAAVLLILGHLFENREENVVAGSIVDLPMGAEVLLMPDRISMGM
jgi:hypothetical protein